MRSHGRLKQQKEITLMKTKLVKSMMAPLVVACASLTMVVATATGQGTQGGTLQGTWDMRITLTDCRSRDKEFPVTNRIRGGRHGSGVERGDTAGPEDAWRRCLEPYHWQ